MSALDELKKRRDNEDDLSPLEFVILRDSGEWSGAPEESEKAAEILAAINDALEEAKKLIVRNQDWLNKAPFDYSNGNTDSTGTLDEGDYYGWRGHKEITAANFAWLSSHKAGE